MTYNVFSGTLNPTHFTSLHLAVLVCGHFGLWLFWSVAISVVAVLVYGRFGIILELELELVASVNPNHPMDDIGEES